MLLPGRQLIFGKNGLHRTFGLAKRAIDAFVRIDHQKIRPFVETIHGTNLDAVCQFTLDTGFGDDECHVGTSISGARTLCEVAALIKTRLALKL